MDNARGELSSSEFFRNSFHAEGAPNSKESPEAFAGLLRSRFFAFLADMAVITVLIFSAAMLFGILGILSLGILWPGFGIITPGLFFAYFTLTLGGSNSATPGMQWQGIKMRTWDGFDPGYVQAFAQTFLFYLITTPLLGLSLLVALFNSRKRCLHDYLSGSVFIRVRPAH